MGLHPDGLLTDDFAGSGDIPAFDTASATTAGDGIVAHLTSLPGKQPDCRQCSAKVQDLSSQSPD